MSAEPRQNVALVLADALYAVRDSHPHFDTQGLDREDCLVIARVLLEAIEPSATDRAGDAVQRWLDRVDVSTHPLDAWPVARIAVDAALGGNGDG